MQCFNAGGKIGKVKNELNKDKRYILKTGIKISLVYLSNQNPFKVYI